MNFQLSLEKISKFGQKAKILGKNENAHEIRKKVRFMSGRDFASNKIYIINRFTVITRV